MHASGKPYLPFDNACVNQLCLGIGSEMIICLHEDDVNFAVPSKVAVLAALSIAKNVAKAVQNETALIHLLEIWTQH